MRWVPAAAARPHRCACIPFLSSHHPEGFFDFGTEIMAFDGHVYVSVVAARQMAEAMGWELRGDEQPSREVERLKDALAEVAAERDALASQLEAVHVLKRGGFQTARKPGRPPKDKAVA